VVELDSEDVRDIYLTREGIERAAVHTLIRHTDGAALEPLSKIVKQMESAVRRRRGASLAELDLQFHAALVEASGSRRLKRVMQALLVETKMCLTRLEDRYPHAEELVAEHREILDALLTRDETLALRLVSEHMADAVNRLVAEPDSSA
jgi:DNA-binding GntR family transcriptional regulator